MAVYFSQEKDKNSYAKGRQIFLPYELSSLRILVIIKSSPIIIQVKAMAVI